MAPPPQVLDLVQRFGRLRWSPKLDCSGRWRSLPNMQASPNNVIAGWGKGSAPAQAVPECGAVTEDDLDLSLLEDSLKKTPWERMLANDDALRFAESLRAALEKRHAKP